MLNLSWCTHMMAGKTASTQLLLPRLIIILVLRKLAWARITF